MSKDKAPREFWIDHECIGDSCQSTCHVYTTPSTDDIHVIEKSYAAELEQKLAECVAVLKYIQNDMPTKAKEKFDKNEVTYFCEVAGAEVLDPRFEHAIIAREVLARVKK